ncbi:alpha/beta hydrolase [archaeon]|nr:alpha/beta hydrolase [archaeon]
MYNQSRVWFRNSKGQRLAGILYRQRAASALAVLVPGLAGGKSEGELLVSVAKALASKGYNVIRFDHAGVGESDGKSEDTTRMTRADDVKSAIAFCKKVTSSKNVVLIGLSIGAAVSVLAYSGKEKTMVFYSPALDYSVMDEFRNTRKAMRELAEKGYITGYSGLGYIKLGKGMVYETDRLDLQEYAGKVKCPVLLIRGSKDGDITTETAKRTAKWFKNAEFREIKGADHMFTGRGQRSTICRLTLEWLAGQLS